MRTENELDELLGNTAGPSLVEGPHRAALKAQLIRASRKDASSMTKWKRITLVAVLIAAGAAAWAAQQAWRVFIVEESDGPVVEHRDGSASMVRSTVAVSSNDPEFSQAQADEQWAQMKQAIADGSYQLRDTVETNGITVYLYDITLPDGKVVGFGRSQPLEEIEIGDPAVSADE